MVFIIICAFFIAQAQAFLSLCPRRNVGEERFIGSSETDISNFPYQVALQLNYWKKLNIFVCGGSIIKSDVILTSAYCTHGTSNSNWNVRAGSSNYKSGGQVARVKTIIEHNDFNEILRFNDISLLFLQNPLPLGNNIAVIAINFKPIISEYYKFEDLYDTTDPSIIWKKKKPPMPTVPTMPTTTTLQPPVTNPMTKPPTTKPPTTKPPTTKPPTTTPPSGQNKYEVIATGWGSNNKKKWCLSSSLRMIKLNVISNDECRDYYPNRLIPPSMMCASRSSGKFLNIRRNTCKGDIGGPLTQNNLLVGITSWGTGCFSSEYPIVFTRISSYKEWISSKVEPKL